MPKVYTKIGDRGETYIPLFGKVSKSHPVAEAVGSLDELNASIGVVRNLLQNGQFFDKSVDRFLEQIQNALFNIGSLIVFDDSSIDNLRGKGQDLNIYEESVKTIEKHIDHLDSKNEKLTAFILPTGDYAVHMARAICRRAERTMVRLQQDKRYWEKTDVGRLDVPIQFLNRLSDYLFVLARCKSKDAIWAPADIP